jgi:hypothetical protein
MGKKLMEITEFKKKLKKGQATLKLLDTGFSQLTRKITSDPGASYLTAEAADPFSKEVIVSLNQAQLEYKPRLENLFAAYNAWIDSVKSKLPEISNFTYNFTSLIDYSSAYIAGVTPADYYMLKSIVNAEKEIYESCNFWLEQHMLGVLAEMKATTNNYDGHYTTDHPTLPYMMARVIDDEKLYGQYRRGNQWYVLTDTYEIGVVDSRARITLSISSQPEGSHEGNNITTSTSYTYVEVRDPETDELMASYPYKHFSTIGGDYKVNFTDRLLEDLSFESPVKISVRFNMTLGGYVAHMDGERYWTSVIQYITLKWAVE